MKEMVRARAISVMTLLWMVLWLPFAITAHLAILFEPPHHSVAWSQVLRAVRYGVLTAGLWGPGSGVVFAALLATAERGGAIGQLVVRRVILWGAISGASLPVLLLVWDAVQIGITMVVDWRNVTVVGLGAAYGALIAAGLVLLAQRAPAA
ncbi:MAG: hypothetical protein HOQ11_16650 [Gemmatimonadaceae bacterium]|nr:hypothetical protein [Gemmatimonadaceae bacterium]NUS99033.1 hypothetical protein [Gemmatimonadaceae bacterium]